MTSLSSFRPNLRWLIELKRISDKNWKGVRDVDALIRKIDRDITHNRERTNLQIHRDMYPRLAPFCDHIGPDGRKAFLSTETRHQINAKGEIRSGDHLREQPGWSWMKEYTKPTYPH